MFSVLFETGFERIVILNTVRCGAGGLIIVRQLILETCFKDKLAQVSVIVSDIILPVYLFVLKWLHLFCIVSLLFLEIVWKQICDYV